MISSFVMDQNTTILIYTLIDKFCNMLTILCKLLYYILFLKSRLISAISDISQIILLKFSHKIGIFTVLSLIGMYRFGRV